MYPYLKLISTFIGARKRPKMELQDKSVLRFRAGLSDIDLFWELNNARYFNYMELGRWDYSYRTGFLKLMRQNKWGVAVGGASIRYRRRIPFLHRFTLSTRLICHDGRWIYFLQETHSNNKICSSALMRVCVVSKGKLYPARDVIKHFEDSGWADEIPDWVKAWLEAEDLRPWPEK